MLFIHIDSFVWLVMVAIEVNLWCMGAVFPLCLPTTHYDDSLCNALSFGAVRRFPNCVEFSLMMPLCVDDDTDNDTDCQLQRGSSL